jgi:thiol:disulfide interchange protein
MIYHEIKNERHFAEILQKNEGMIIVKLTATWCGPCQQIKQYVHSFFDYMMHHHSNIQCYDIDIDKNPAFYALLKKKRVANGVPVLMYYKQGNISVYPDDIVIGAHAKSLNELFERCIVEATKFS